MLYVPPGVGHRGITVASAAEIALTYSVGFRAPSTADLLSSLFTRAVARETPHLFRDPGRRRVSDPGELSRRDINALRDFLAGAVDGADPDDWAIAAGEAVTAGGGGRSPLQRLSAKSVGGRLAEGASLSPAPGTRMTWSRLPHGRAALFVNGESRVLPREQAFVAPFVCGLSSRASARRVAAHPAGLSLVLDLLRAGAIAFVE